MTAPRVGEAAVSTGFLSPYKVLDLTNHRGLLAGKMLAQLGADVVHVEPPNGSTARSVGPWRDSGERRDSLYWEAYACNQRGITCNTDSTEGRELLLELATVADFVFESELPGVMAARRLSYDDVRAVRADTVYVSISPFGETGPKSRYADSDLVLWAAGGPLFLHRDGEKPPVRISVPQAYLAAGADAAAGALLAHLWRVRSGQGQHVSVSIQASVAQAMIGTILAAAAGDSIGGSWIHPKSEVIDNSTHTIRDGAGVGEGDSSTGRARSKWRVRDGVIEMSLAMGSAGHRTNKLWDWLVEEGADGGLPPLDWRALPDMIERGEFELDQTNPYRYRIGKFLASKSKRDIEEASAQRSLLAAPISSVADIAGNPQHQARDFWMTIAPQTVREITIPGSYARVTETAFRPEGTPAPGIGQHNTEVLREWLGLGEDAVHGLRSKGAI
jgi:crotonobetainyl-CoA:carnitine CoA-transferase CaiB-like acyl-CoA transferase